MSVVDSLIVRLGMDASGYVSEAKKAARATDDIADTAGKAGKQGSGAFSQMGASMGGLAKAAAGAFAVKQVADFTKAAVASAANLGESVNAVQVVFQDGAQTILDYGKTAATSVGLAAVEFNSLATNTGALLTNFGYSQQQAADEAINLTERAADMASVFNTDVSESLFAVQAALRGETEPIRRFGVSLDDASIRAKAVELGLAATTAEVDKHGKAQAALALIYQQTAAVQGDFANTSGSLANQQRILAAEMENAKAEMGEALIPLFTSLVGVVRELMPSLIDIGKGFADLIASVQPLIRILSKVLGPVLAGVADYLGLVADGVTSITALLGDDAAKAALRFEEALEHVNSAAGRGQQAAAAYADGLVHMARDGALTEDAIRKLGEGVEFVGQQQAQAIREARDWAVANGATEAQILLLNEALYDQITALIAAGEIGEEWIDILGLTEIQAARAAGAAGDVAGAAGEVGDAAEDAADGMGEMADEAKTLADRLWDAYAAQKSLADVLKAAADPAFAAVRAYQEYQRTLEEIDEDGKRTADEQLELARAVLEAQGALDAFTAGGVEDAAIAIAEALGIGVEAAKDLLRELGILDGTEVTAIINVSAPQAAAFNAFRQQERQSSTYGTVRAPAAARQHGGPVAAGRPYLVGEAGAELFVPSAAGIIIPNQMMGGNTVSVTVNNPSTSNLAADLQLAGLLGSVLTAVK